MHGQAGGEIGVDSGDRVGEEVALEVNVLVPVLRVGHGGRGDVVVSCWRAWTDGRTSKREKRGEGRRRVLTSGETRAVLVGLADTDVVVMGRGLDA